MGVTFTFQRKQDSTKCAKQDYHVLPGSVACCSNILTIMNNCKKSKHCFSLQEMNKFQTILLDQASCIILKNITSFIKTEIKGVKEHRTHFSKVSETYDAALTRNAQANKNKPLEVSDAENTLSASSSCFRHIALDYVYTLTSLQSKKMHDILSTLLSYYQACNTFYHQGNKSHFIRHPQILLNRHSSL